VGRRSGNLSRSGAVLALVLAALEATTACGKSETGDDKTSSACSAGTPRGGAGGGSGRSGTAAGQGGGGSAGASTTGSGGGAERGGSDATSNGGSTITITGGSAGQVCTGVTLKTSPTALYLMLDASGSMLDPSGSGVMTKWTAVKDGVVAFLHASSDLEVALGYFPERVAGVPDTCTSDADCGTAAPCLTHVCQQTPGALVACTPTSDPADAAPCTDAIVRDDGPCSAGACRLTGAACQSDDDCRVRDAALGRCVELGTCEADPTLTCADVNPGKPQAGCGPNGSAGMCLPNATGYCLHETVCDPQSYAEPALDFPATTSAVESSLAAQTPRGDSPARAALRGAIAHARAFRAEHPEIDVAVVLATDGWPTDCSTGRANSAETSTALDELVAEARDGYVPMLEPGAPSVRTFVLGVLGDADTSAAPDLDRVAEAGGSQQAYVLPADDDTVARLSAALAAIRDASLACRFVFPAGQTIDASLVNVALESGPGSSEVLENVAPDGCSATGGEWYFEADPTSGRPLALDLCPATCDRVTASPETQLSVMIGCPLAKR